MLTDRGTLVVAGGSILLLGVVLGLIYGTGPWDSTAMRWTQESSPATDTVARGRTLYRRHCVSCHGKSGRADGPASEYLSTSPLNFHSDTAASYTGDTLFQKISEGNPKNGMPAWKGTLSRQERMAIVRYLHQKVIPHPETE